MEKSPYSLQLEKAHSQPQRHSATKTAAAAKSLQSCPTLCDPRDGSPPGSPVPGILQARTLEWVAISFSNAWKWKVKVKSLSRVQLLATPWTAAHQAPPPMGFARQEYPPYFNNQASKHKNGKWGTCHKLRCCTSSPTFGVIRLLNVCQYDMCIVLYHRGINLYSFFNMKSNSFS